MNSSIINTNSNVSELREWFYIDSTTSTQKGPITTLLLKRFIEKGIGIAANTLAWKQGMQEWLPLSSVNNFLIFLTFKFLFPIIRLIYLKN